MPLYDFRCPQCGLEFEVSRPRSEAGNPASCPKDGTEAMRIWSSVGILHGEGGSSSVLDDGGDDDLGHGHSHGPGGHMH